MNRVIACIDSSPCIEEVAEAAAWAAKQARFQPKQTRLRAMQAREVTNKPYLPALPRCGICHLSLDEGWRVS